VIHDSRRISHGFHPFNCNCRRDFIDTEQSKNLSGWPEAKWPFRILYVIRTRERAVETKPSFRANFCQEKIFSEDEDEVRCFSPRLWPGGEPEDFDASGRASRNARLRFGLGRGPIGDAVED
jgi:hypothetical protein